VGYLVTIGILLSTFHTDLGAGVFSDPPTLSPERQAEILEELSVQLIEHYVVAEQGELYSDAIETARAGGQFSHPAPSSEFTDQTNRLLQAVRPDGHLGLILPERFAEISILFGLETDQSTSSRQGTMQPADEAGEVDAPHHGNLDPPEDAETPDRSTMDSRGGHSPIEARRAREARGRERLRVIAGITGVSEISRDGLNQVGYVAFERLIGQQHSLAVMERVFSTFTESDNIIIDLRECRGGDVGAVNAISSYFFPTPTHFLSSQVRGEPVVERWTEPIGLSAALAEIPLKILISERTFSACESLAFGLQIAGRASLYGGRTGGGGYMNDFYPLPHGFGASISIGRSFDPETGEGWQINGVEPDVALESDYALAETLEIITVTSGRRSALSYQHRQIYSVLQAYSDAWYSAEPEAMAELISNDFRAVYQSEPVDIARNYLEHLQATEDGEGVLEPLFHNRIIRDLNIQGTAATARLILRETDHQIELVFGNGEWQISRDYARYKAID